MLRHSSGRNILALEEGASPFGSATPAPPSLIRKASFTGVFTSASRNSSESSGPCSRDRTLLASVGCLFACCLVSVASFASAQSTGAQVLAELSLLRHKLDVIQAAHSDVQGRLQAAEEKHSLWRSSLLSATTQIQELCKATQTEVVSSRTHLKSFVEHAVADASSAERAHTTQQADRLRSELTHLEARLLVKLSEGLASSAAVPPAVAPSAPLARLPPAARPAVPMPRHPASSDSADSADVKVIFRFPKGLGARASVYWLARNSTEHLYSEVPAGKQVVETTRPGECWRVRDADNGNHLVSRYCATHETMQEVTIEGHAEVLLEFRYPAADHPNPTPPLMASPTSAVELWELPSAVHGTVTTRPLRVGTLPRGAHMSVRASAGSQFQVIESGTRRTLSTVRATAEAGPQFVTVGETRVVDLEFVSPRTARESFSVFSRKLGDEEHLVRSRLQPGQAFRVASAVGEEWVVRESKTDAHVLTWTASVERTQRIHVEQSGRAMSNMTY